MRQGWAKFGLSARTRPISRVRIGGLVIAAALCTLAVPTAAAMAGPVPSVAAFACSLSGPLTSTPAGAPHEFYWNFQLSGICRNQAGRQLPAQVSGGGAVPGDVITSSQPQPDGLCAEAGHVVGGLPDFVVSFDLPDPATGGTVDYAQWWALDATPGADGTAVDTADAGGSPAATVAQLSVSSLNYVQLQQGALVGPGWAEGAGTFATRIFASCPSATTSSSNLSVTTTFTPTVGAASPSPS